ncbi:MAG: hypothetical protein M0Z34_05930 [Nitrospiraceae bacterium]|nr:hypothetical protein [Nitrospiraceae bacterium]MDA8262044.1 hypothetical protein [Actinomycetota bacterium]
MRFESITRRRKAFSRQETANAISAALEMFPGIGFDWQPADLHLAWTDGPGPGTVWRAAGEPAGWTYEHPAFYASGTERGDKVLMARTHSTASLRQAAVRFWAVVERPPDLSRERDLERLAQILDGDQPLAGSFPIVERIAAALADGLPAELGDPGAYLLEAATLIDRLGYNRLWDEAYKLAE